MLGASCSSCCERWYCCQDKAQFCNTIAVSATVSATNWRYKTKLTYDNCNPTYHTFSFDGADANGTHALSRITGTNEWFGAVSCGCWLYFHYLAPLRFQVGFATKSAIQIGSYAEPGGITCDAAPTNNSFFQCLTGFGCDNESVLMQCEIPSPLITQGSDCYGSQIAETIETGSRVIQITFALQYL